MASFTNVQADQQWIRRCKMEEMNLIDSFAGPKADRLGALSKTKQNQHFYPNAASIKINP